MNRAFNFSTLLCVGASLLLPACGNSMKSSANTTTAAPPDFVFEGDCFVFTPSNSPTINIFLTQDNQNNKGLLRYYFLYPSGQPVLPLCDNQGMGAWDYRVILGGSQLSMGPIMNGSGANLGFPLWQPRFMTWDTATTGTAEDATGAPTIPFVYIPNGTGPALAPVVLTVGARLFLSHTGPNAGATETFDVTNCTGTVDWTRTGAAGATGSGTFLYLDPFSAGNVFSNRAKLIVDIPAGFFTHIANYDLTWTSRVAGTFTETLGGEGTFAYDVLP